MIKALYITAPNPFQEVEDFVDQAVHDYNLDLVRLGGGMKSALGLYLDDSGEGGAVGSEEEGKGKGQGKGVKGMLVGTRRNDPHGGTFAPFLLPLCGEPMTGCCLNKATELPHALTRSSFALLFFASSRPSLPFPLATHGLLVAFHHAHPPDSQLDIHRRLGLPPRVQDPVVLALRRGVRSASPFTPFCPFPLTTPRFVSFFYLLIHGPHFLLRSSLSRVKVHIPRLLPQHPPESRSSPSSALDRPTFTHLANVADERVSPWSDVPACVDAGGR